MILFVWEKQEGRRLVLGLLLAGAAAGALGPSLAPVLGPAGVVAALAVALVLGGWMARGARGPLLGPLALAAAGGGLAGLLAPRLAPGASHALLGLAVGSALAAQRGGEEGLAPALDGAMRAALGALLGGMAAGALLLAPLAASLSPAGAAALTATVLAASIAGAELTRGLLWVDAAPPAEVAALLAECGPTTQPVLAAAEAAHRRAVRAVLEAVRAGGPLGFRPRQPLGLARRLLEAAARAAAASERDEGALAALGEDAGALEAHPDLVEARRRLRTTLAASAERARQEAGRHAAGLERLALALTDPAAAWPESALPAAPGDVALAEVDAFARIVRGQLAA